MANGRHSLHPAIPRVQCPECGAIMRLSKIEPVLPDDSRVDRVTFDCGCGYVYQHREPARAV